MWSEKRSMDDILEIVDGKYILKGRVDNTMHLDELIKSWGYKFRFILL